MPKLNEEFIRDLLPRLEALLQSGNICTIEADDGSILLCEMWRFPERKETDPENEYEIYPLAKLLTEDEVAELKLGGKTPEDKNE